MLLKMLGLLPVIVTSISGSNDEARAIDYFFFVFLCVEPFALMGFGTRSRRRCHRKCFLRRCPRASVDSARDFTRWAKQTNAHFGLTSSRHLRVLKPA